MDTNIYILDFELLYYYVIIWNFQSESVFPSWYKCRLTTANNYIINRSTAVAIR